MGRHERKGVERGGMGTGRRGKAKGRRMEKEKRGVTRTQGDVALKRDREGNMAHLPFISTVTTKLQAASVTFG